MPFVDNITKIAKTVGGGAASAATNIVKKSSQVVEISRHTVTMAANEDRIDDIYKQIGKYVFKKFEAGEEQNSEIINKCVQIRTIEEENEGLKEKISELKNMKVCHKCGYVMKKEILYCSQCGAKQAIIHEEKTEDNQKNK